MTASCRRVLQQVRASARASCVLVGALLLVLWLPSLSLAQLSTASVLSRRPWVGFWFGGTTAFNTDMPRSGFDTQMSFEVPIDRTGGLRVAVGRAWVNEGSVPDLSIQRLVVYALGERVISTGPWCVNTVYGGLGAGIYFYNFDDVPGRIRRTGYQVVVGGGCAMGRLSTGVEMHGRRIGSPGLGPPRDRGVTAIDLVLGVRVRL